jgi:hypothetical protein
MVNTFIILQLHELQKSSISWYLLLKKKNYLLSHIHSGVKIHLVYYNNKLCALMVISLYLKIYTTAAITLPTSHVANFRIRTIMAILLHHIVAITILEYTPVRRGPL